MCHFSYTVIVSSIELFFLNPHGQSDFDIITYVKCVISDKVDHLPLKELNSLFSTMYSHSICISSR